MRLEELLCGWLPEQRWFGGKGRIVDEVTIESDTTLPVPRPEGEPIARHLIVRVRQGTHTERYQLLLGIRETLPDRLKHAEIGWCGDGLAYDGVHDGVLTRTLLDLLAAGEQVDELSFQRLGDTRISTGLSALVIGGEQSNTSVVFGEAYVCKLFRRLSPGLNPDLELAAALARIGSRHVASPLGWLGAPLDGEMTTLAVLSEYLTTATDGWTLAATSVRDLYAEDEELSAADAGGDFAGEAERLGRATAVVHRDLARAFGVAEMPAEAVREMAAEMRTRLKRATEEVAELVPHEAALAAAFDELYDLDAPLRVQRVHGDYHLGQVLRTNRRWVLLDFEGEPARPLTQRREMASPLRDVAGMLRSFDYAAHYQLVGRAKERRLERHARDWAHRNREAFCVGYLAGGGTDLRANRVALRAFEFDKAVYEVMYEARNRPAWLPIPLSSIARLA